MTTLPHDPANAAELAAIQTPDGEPDAQLIDPEEVDADGDESLEDVRPHTAVEGPF